MFPFIDYEDKPVKLNKVFTKIYFWDDKYLAF